MSTAEADWAWAAGLFEGEGSISIYDRYIMLAMTTTDRDVLERFARVIGYGKVHASPMRLGQRKQQYRWAVGRREVCVSALHNMLPWLGERRSRRALEALAHAASKGGRPKVPTRRQSALAQAIFQGG